MAAKKKKQRFYWKPSKHLPATFIICHLSQIELHRNENELSAKSMCTAIKCCNFHLILVTESSSLFHAKCLFWLLIVVCFDFFQLFFSLLSLSLTAGCRFRTPSTSVCHCARSGVLWETKITAHTILCEPNKQNKHSTAIKATMNGALSKKQQQAPATEKSRPSKP